MQNRNESRTKSSLSRLIERIPVPIKAIVVGIVVYAIGSFPSLAAISFLPLPFSIIVLFLFLFLYVKYFSGRWGDESSSSVRSRTENFRSIKLTGSVWAWGVTGALLFVVVLQSIFVVTFRVFEYDPDVMMTFQLGDLPLWYLWLAAIASALIAGVSEEIGFRGYMQTPLATRYRPWVANVIVSVVFVLFHLNQGWAQPALYGLLFVGSFMLGLLATASGSLIPSIIAHFVVDIFNFGYWWSDIAGEFEHRPISETGIDTHFLVWVAVLVSSLLLFLLATRKTESERLRSTAAEMA
ncbi:MAG: CPBP family intramembrane metalloprotease [Anaerolineae bacterium]|nr:CPBP family intramembrane metalloprotease [Anaerolineae bacterium]